MSITKIVLTGGPCSGKSTAQSYIENAFSDRGYTVLFVPEAATELAHANVKIGVNVDYYPFQKNLLKLQIETEKVFESIAASMDSEKILIVCDRGALDGKAYMRADEFAKLMEDLGTNEIELRDNYDAVFHLITTAKGAPEAYTLSNNTARKETPEQAAALDDKTISAWTGHPHFRIIENSPGGVDNKMKKLISEIASFLGEPEPYEIERKFLIKYPDIEKLAALPNCEKIEIIQTYLKSDSDDELRVRQRGANGNYIYFETHKKALSGIKRIEKERRLTEKEYLSRLMLADTNMRPIRKDRYCLADGNQYFEIDIYPFWTDQAIMEIELSDASEEIRFPEMIEVIREVTDDPAYKNSALARM